ncbi:MAG: alpha/beta hydrolase fold domain-containing protein [Actinomycetota bacterium]|nr:alpha/beta hydrolase fold domain-containing protein [Actinomycetota bacterium]
MTSPVSPHLPGRLGDPDRTIADDVRADPRMVVAMAAVGLDAPPPPMPVGHGGPISAIHEVLNATEEGFGAIWEALFTGLPPVPGVTSRTEIITGVDNNDVSLYIHEPAERSGPLPAIVHTHGGGMVLAAAADPNYVRWRDELAATGLVVVGVEFRNGGGKLGPHPFPAGLNDCAAAARWVADNAERLGVSKVVMSGESGGGNLALATTLKARQDGWLDAIAGVYAQCPYVSNLYHAPPPELTSLHENDGYFLSCDMMGPLARAYDPDGNNATNPLAWPYHASGDDLTGLPPHVISVNQLDPLRDEGLAYHRKLLDAGVSSVSRTVNGTCHAGDCIFRAAMPDVYAATIRDISAFAHSL